MPKIIFPSGGAGGGGTSLTIQEEGVDVQTDVNTINFVGADVEAQAGSAGVVLVYIPPPTFASHYNTQDGTTDARVRQSTATVLTKYISSPTSEGVPFNTGGDAASNALASNSTAINLAPSADITAMENSTFKVDVTEPDGTVMETYTTSAITGNGTFTSPSGDIVVTVSSYSADTTKYKARVNVLVTYADILATAGFDGGKFNIVITQTVTDGTGPHVFNLSTSTNPTILGDFFYDTNTPLASFPQNVAISETAGSVTTKHLSGLEYYTTGSRFTVSCTDLDNLNRNTALTSANITVIDNSTFGYTNINQSPLPGGAGNANFTGWTSAYDNTGVSYSNNAVTINRSNFRYTGTSGRANINVNLVWGGTRTTQSSIQSILVDTYSTASSNLIEYFDSENRRLESDYTTAWTSSNALSQDKAATCKIEVVDNASIVGGDTITLVDATGINRVLTAGTTFAVGASASDTATNIFNAINATYGTEFTAVVDTYTNTIVNVTQDTAGPDGNQTNTSSRVSAITVTDFEEGSNDAMVYYGQLQQFDQARLGGTGSINTDWSAYKPDAGGANPDYSGLTSGPATFYREITDTSGLSRSSFQMVFTGTFVSSATTDLANGDLRVFVRKIASPTGGALVGTSIVPMRLHGGTFGSAGPFDQGQTVGGSYIREGSSSGNTVNATFGTYKCEDGIYIEVMIYNSAIKIDRINVTFF